MDKEAQKIPVELLKKASDGIDSAVSFSQAQIPDIIHQFLLWQAASSAGIQVICVLAIAVCVYLMIFAWNKSDDVDITLLSPAVLSGITLVAIFVFFNYFDWLKIWLAPKVYLIEYAASLAK